jgi:tetratricopeptide (TPR) repeat protein
LAWTNLLVGTYKIGLGEWQEVESLAGKAIRLSQDLGDLRVMGLSLGLLTLAPIGQGRFDESLELYKKWHQIALEGNNIQHQAFGYFGQAENLIPLNQIDESIEIIEQGLHLLVEKAERSFENRTAEIRGLGLLAVARLRQVDNVGALQAANETMTVIEQLSAPTRVTLLEGLSGATEVYLRLWQLEAEGKRDGQDLKSSAKRAVDVLNQYARVFPIGKPRAYIWQGLYSHLSGQDTKAQKAWLDGSATARRMGMPYEEALALWELGRLESGSEGARYRTQAQRIFSELGVNTISTSRQDPD